MRETARLLKCNYKTVNLKFLWASRRAKEFHLSQNLSAETILFDEMESIEHTKLKPLTIAVAVNEKYKILGVQVGEIPAKGHLAEISVKKYGHRKNESSEKVEGLLSQVRSQLKTEPLLIKSDAKPVYSHIVKNIFPESIHEQYVSAKSKKSKEQKYLKSEKYVYDPLFEINHTHAVFRDHLKRLVRRNWCTTKIKEHLELAIYLYIAKKNNYTFL